MPRQAPQTDRARLVAPLTRERLQDGARELGQPEIAIPRQIVHVAALPLLGSGKLDHVAY